MLKEWIVSRRELKPFVRTYKLLRYHHNVHKCKGKLVCTPKVLYIETTNFCNARCVMCPHKTMKRKKGTMSWETFTKIIDELKEIDFKGMIHLANIGEPLLDPLLFKRIKYTKSNLPNSHVHFETNAMLLGKEKSKKLLLSGLDSITFSFDGASKETYEKIRIGLKFDTVKKNIENFLKMKKEFKNDIYVKIQMVVNETNIYETEKYRKMWTGKVDKVFIKSMHNFLDAGMSIKTKELSKKQTRFCIQPFEWMLISWDGDVSLCCWDYNNYANLGNVKEGLMKIFNNEKYKKIRSAMSKMDCSKIVPCNRCSQIYGKDIFFDISA